MPKENIIEINFESRHFKKLEDADHFYQYVTERAEHLFFDEIQHVKEWHSVIPSFRIDFDCDIDDNYPKYVISSDIVDLSRKGIVHYNIIDFLLDEKEM